MFYELVFFEVQRNVAINGIVVIIFLKFGYSFLDVYNLNCLNLFLEYVLYFMVQ